MDKAAALVSLWSQVTRRDALGASLREIWRPVMMIKTRFPAIALTREMV